MRIGSTQEFRDFRACHVGIRLLEFAGDLGVGLADVSILSGQPVTGALVNGVAAAVHVASGIERIRQTRKEALMMCYEGASPDAAQLCAVEAAGDALGAAGFTVLASGASPVVGYGLVATGTLTSLLAGWRQKDI